MITGQGCCNSQSLLHTLRLVHHTGPEDTTLEKDPQTTFLSRADAGDPYDAPPLATCSYFEFDRKMGTAVRITRSAPRGISLPNPRWTDQPHWPTVRELAPGPSYFRKGLLPAVFRDFYLDDLNKLGARAVAAALRAIPCDDTGQLVLLCFESGAEIAADPWKCHRRIFAEWWAGLTGRDVPELTR
jgi:hypothetical protein